MPVDVERMGRNGQLFMEGAEAIGTSGGPLSRNAGRCVQCSSCPKGCRLDAKRAMHVSYLPRAVEAGARVRAGANAERIVLEGRRAVGVRCSVDADGEGPRRDYAVRAPTVVCAGGAFGTPELLLRSGVRGRQRRAGAQPARPPGRLDRRAVRRRGARVGRRDAELLRRRVVRPRAAARGHVHAARLRSAMAPRGGPRAPGPDARLRPHRLDRRSPQRPLLGSSRARRQRSRCG